MKNTDIIKSTVFLRIDTNTELKKLAKVSGLSKTKLISNVLESLIEQNNIRKKSRRRTNR